MTSRATLHDGDEPVVLDGRYLLEALVGEGGYSRVYRAADQALGRRVAIKLFTADAPDARDTIRMQSETRLLASLSHPSLVTLHDARLDASPAYLVMEFVDGPTLRSAIAEGPMPPSAVATLATELGEALQVIHGAGVVHRDIKPSNVLLRPPPVPGGDRRATLADFGIASLVDSTRITAAGTLVGTAAYLSPEQARGERPSYPSDIYSLGLVLREALTGTPAFPDTTPHEALVARLSRSPGIPAELPPDWRALLSAMTALDPAHRPDAAAVVRAAARMRGAEPLTAAALSAPQPAPDPPTAVLAPAADTATPQAGTDVPRSHRGGWMLGAALGVAAAGIVVAVAALTATVGAPSPSPTLPALPEPLGPRFDDLWRQLQP